MQYDKMHSTITERKKLKNEYMDKYWIYLTSLLYYALLYT